MKTWLILLVSIATTIAADFPDTVLPQTCGVNIHFTRGHEKDLDLIAAAGFKFVRMDFTWELIEQKRGEYDWSHYDELTRNLKQRGLRAIYILDYSNGLYEPEVESRNGVTQQSERRPGSPQHPESVAAFSRWAAAAAKHFHNERVVWEIFNEPNGFFWKPKPNVEQYTALALSVSKAIRAADRRATIVAPATAGVPLDFLEPFLKSGVLEYIDGVSIHPYRGLPPETAGPDYQKVRELIDRYAPKGKKNKIPILSGEWGYSSNQGGYAPETQAAYLARQQLFNLLNGIPLSIWYDWKNDGPDPKEAEHNFGTVTSDLEPKPSYRAIQKLTSELAGYRVVRRLPTEKENDFVLLCRNKKGMQKVAVWTTDKPHEIETNGKNFQLTATPEYFVY